jgi:NitT/TauT family transport system permease protein
MKNNSMYTVLGWFVILLVWFAISSMELINHRVLPSPGKTWASFIDMLQHRDLIGNLLFSLKINYLGYIIAIGTALPVGFAVGLSEFGKKMFDKPINALRFIPITALGGIFIAISGLSIWTKILFLAFGIWVYLVPVVIQRLQEVSGTHLQMMQTLGATKWQIFKNVQWPYVTSRLSDDIRILVGISWTYIIVAELKNVQGGVGSMIWLGERQANPGYVYAILILIIIVGVLQDWKFGWIDRILFKFKHA